MARRVLLASAMKAFDTIDSLDLDHITGGLGGMGVKLPVSHFKLPPNTAGHIIALTPGSEGGVHLPRMTVPVNTAGKIIRLTPGSEGGVHR
jgi:hypothetical protein